jgi:hypothetical protein
MVRWSVDIIRDKKVEHLGTLEALDQRTAYKAAIEKFDVPIERQNRLFVTKLGERDTGSTVAPTLVELAHVAEDHRGFDETKERRSIASGAHQCIFAGQRRDCFPCLRFGHRRQRWYELHRVPIWSTARRVNASDLDSGEVFAT